MSFDSQSIDRKFVNTGSEYQVDKGQQQIRTARKNEQQHRKQKVEQNFQTKQKTLQPSMLLMLENNLSKMMEFDVLEILLISIMTQMNISI